MAAATSSVTRDQTPSTGSQIFNSIYEIGVSTGAGALAGYVFGVINPVGGAIFGASFALTNTIAIALADKFLIDKTALKVTALIASCIASLAVGAFTATMAGFPLTLLGTVGMVLAMCVTNCAIRTITGGVSCCSPILGGAGLALKERFC